MKPKELKNIAPTLFNIQDKGTGFKIPKDYFEEFDDTIKTRLFIDTLPDKTGQSIPDDYFNSIEERIMSKISLQDKDVDKIIPDQYFETIEDKVFAKIKEEDRSKQSIISKYWFTAAVAASIALLISIYNPFGADKNLDVAEIEEYIEAENINLSTYELADLYGSEIDNLTIDNAISPDELEDYLEEDFSESIFYN